MSFGCEDPHHCVTCADEGVASFAIPTSCVRTGTTCETLAVRPSPVVTVSLTV